MSTATQRASRAAQRTKKLFVTNPMRMEIARFKGRFTHATPSVALNRAFLALVVLGYCCILGMVLTARTSLHVGAVFGCQMVITFLAVIGVAHGAIAGERDRRSWDLLQVAPITQAEIVVGKFMGALAMIAGLALVALPFAIVGLIFYQDPHSVPTVYQALLSEIVVLSSAAAVAAYTIYLSARLKNANSALVASIGSVVGVLVVVPAMLALLAPHASQLAADLVLWWHPFWVLARILLPADVFAPFMTHSYGWASGLFYIGVSWVFLSATIRHLRRKPTE